jgi:hypothetical protein
VCAQEFDEGGIAERVRWDVDLDTAAREIGGEAAEDLPQVDVGSAW